MNTHKTYPRLSHFPHSMISMRQLVLRDMPEGVAQPIQTHYLNEVIGFFFRTLIKVYSPEPLSEKDRANLSRYLAKVIEAKDAIDGKSKGREY